MTKRLYRSKTDKKISGVCGGMAVTSGGRLCSSGRSRIFCNDSSPDITSEPLIVTGSYPSADTFIVYSE